MVQDLKGMLESIAKLSSSIDKAAKLESYKTEDHLQSSFTLLRYIFSPEFSFGAGKKAINTYVAIDPTSKKKTDTEYAYIIETLQSNETSKRRVPISTMLGQITVSSDDEKEWLVKLLTSDIVFGMNVKSINKVLAKTPRAMVPIYQPKYMRCSVVDDLGTLEFPIIAQLKEDSEFSNIFIAPGEPGITKVFMESRNGKPQSASIYAKKLEEYIGSVPLIQEEEGWVIHGELMVKGAKTREDNRSAISSLTASTKTRNTLHDKIREAKTEKSKIKFLTELETKESEWNITQQNLYVSVWDIITQEEYELGISKTPYNERLQNLSVFTKESRGLLQMTESWVMKTPEELSAKFDEVLSRGDEGLIVKYKDLIWKDGTSRQQLKMKEFPEFEMEVVGWNPGTGELSDGIGSFQIVSSDGEIVSSAGGLCLADRGLESINPDNSAEGYQLIEGFDLDSYNGKIITIKANAVSKSKKSDKHSLTFPSFIKVREDKDEADDIDYIKNLFKRS